MTTTSTTRPDGREPGSLRPVEILPGAVPYAEGSAMVAFGRTRVLCAATVEDRVPPWLRGAGSGWITAEYAMLPRATHERTPRESAKGRIKGRTHEIQRLIGRSLRAVVDLTELAEQSIIVDCDVVQADGGTRTASITGAWVALSGALDALVRRGDLPRRPTLDPLAAVSVGIVDGRPCLDLDYTEDAGAETDMNVVMASDDRFVEVQGTAEGVPFRRDELDRLLDLAAEGCRTLFTHQADAIEKGRDA